MNARSPSGIDWFRDARFGLFMHYGLYSLLGRGEWVQLTEKIPVGEYEKLKSDFTAAHFDADMITDLALEAEMKYVNITTMHHDGFCLFDTKEARASGKPIELCHHIAGWGYQKANDGKHRGPDSVMKDLEYVSQFNANLLLNTAPLPDGSIDQQDVATLREVGRRLSGQRR